MSRETFGKAMANVEVDVGFPGDLRPYLQQIAEGLFKEKKISFVSIDRLDRKDVEMPNQRYLKFSFEFWTKVKTARAEAQSTPSLEK